VGVEASDTVGLEVSTVRCVTSVPVTEFFVVMIQRARWGVKLIKPSRQGRVNGQLAGKGRGGMVKDEKLAVAGTGE
jgi:hypothetical protein